QGRRAAVKLRRLGILVCLTHRRHAGVNRFFHQLTVQKISCGVRSLVFFISRFLIGIIGDAGFIRIINAGLFRVPFGVGGIIGGFPRLPILGILGASSEFRFAARAQIGNGLGELFGISSKLLNDRGLAGFHLRQLFLLIIGQADSVLARGVIAL